MSPAKIPDADNSDAVKRYCAFPVLLEELKTSFTEQMDALKTDIGSNFVPKAEKKVFAKKVVKPVLTMKEKVAARKEELKK